MPINRTGTPDPSFYNLGRGSVLAADLDVLTGLPSSGYRHLGNCTAFNISFENETLQHQSSRGGIKTTDLEIVVSQTTNISVTLDEISHQNLALAFSGEAADATSAVPTQNSAKIGFADVLQVPSCLKGTWVYLRDASGRRAYDVLQADLTVKTESGGAGGSPGATLVAGTDYILDAKQGGVFLLATGVTHVNGNEVYASLVANATAKDIEQVRSNTKAQVQVALKFISQNPANGDKQREFEFHSVSLAPEGDVSLIGDEYTEITLAGSVGKSVAFTQPITITDHQDA
jgi:hypothetical protein